MIVVKLSSVHDGDRPKVSPTRKPDSDRWLSTPSRGVHAPRLLPHVRGDYSAASHEDRAHSDDIRGSQTNTNMFMDGVYEATPEA